MWWRCEQGHEWQSAIGARVHGSGWPYCAHRGANAATPSTSLHAVDVELTRQWHPTRNRARTPADVEAVAELIALHRYLFARRPQVAEDGVARGQQKEVADAASLLFGSRAMSDWSR